jgi:hypothetical protein
MDAKTKWYVEFLLDAVSTWLIGWIALGGIVSGMVSVGIDPDGGEFAAALPTVAKVTVTYAVWKLFRTFNWLKGVPPERIK